MKSPRTRRRTSGAFIGSWGTSALKTCGVPGTRIVSRSFSRSSAMSQSRDGSITRPQPGTSLGRAPPSSANAAVVQTAAMTTDSRPDR